MSKKYLVQEIFYSIQGEGHNAGMPAVFVRFFGCSEKCTFCDTPQPKEEAREMTAGEIARAVCEYASSSVVLTGGEPLLQVDEALLLTFLRTNLLVHVETNGTIPLGYLRQFIHWLTVSPKSREFIQREGDELKVIIPSKVVQTPEEMIGLSCDDDLHFNYYYVQSQWSADAEVWGKNTRMALACCMENPRWRLSTQVHKLIGVQ